MPDDPTDGGADTEEALHDIPERATNDAVDAGPPRSAIPRPAGERRPLGAPLSVPPRPRRDSLTPSTRPPATQPPPSPHASPVPIAVQGPLASAGPIAAPGPLAALGPLAAQVPVASARIPTPGARPPHRNDSPPSLDTTLVSELDDRKPRHDSEPDIAVELGPPGIPLIVNDLAEDTERKRRKTPTTTQPRKRRTKSASRPTVRIPDDAIPATSARDGGAGYGGAGHDGAAYDGANHDGAFETPPEGGDDDATPVMAHDFVMLEPSDLTPGGSRIVADGLAIGIMRPVQISSDLPPVPSHSIVVDGDARPDARTGAFAFDSSGLSAAEARGAATQDPAPEEAFEALEEVLPDAASLPGPVVARARDPQAPQKRPLPPPRSVQPAPAPPPAHATPVAPAPPRRADAPRSQRPTDPRTGDPRPLDPRPLDPRPIDPQRPTEPPQAPRTKRPFYVDLYEDDMIRTLDNPKQREVESEARFIEESLALPHGSKLLDLACGHGAIATELAGRGYDVTGVDLSETMLTLAKHLGEKKGQSVRLQRGDMRELDVKGAFDGVYCWATSFGYFDDAVNADVLARAAASLRQGGRLLLDVQNRDFVTSRTPSTAWFKRSGCVCMDEAGFDFSSSRLNVKRMAMFENGKAREIDFSIRLYSTHELVAMFDKAGLGVLEITGHPAHRGAFFGSESARTIVLAERLR